MRESKPNARRVQLGKSDPVGEGEGEDGCVAALKETSQVTLQIQKKILKGEREG